MRLAPGLQVICAPNPSPMTFHGTNTYILGQSDVAVIDPGPALPVHLEAILAALDGRAVSHILVTHSHLDHSPLAPMLAAATGAPVCAFGPSDAGRSPVMTDLARQGLAGGGEGIDPDFKPDVLLADGAEVTGAGWALRALHTPGHMGNHLCFIWRDAVFTGDHVMDWSTSLVSPPDGDLTDFMRSCAVLAAEPARIFYPGHGSPVADPAKRLAWLIDHRIGRERQIMAALGVGPLPVDALVRKVYADLAPHLAPAAARNVFAHLIDLVQRGLVQADPHLAPDADFRRKQGE